MTSPVSAIEDIEAALNEAPICEYPDFTDAIREVLALAREAEALKREIVELRKALTDASDAISAFADSVFNDNGDMTVNLGLATGDDYIRAYFADRRARALLSKESAEQDGSAINSSGTGGANDVA